MFKLNAKRKKLPILCLQCVFFSHLKHMCDKLSPKRRTKCCRQNTDRGRVWCILALEWQWAKFEFKNWLTDSVDGCFFRKIFKDLPLQFLAIHVIQKAWNSIMNSKKTLDIIHIFQKNYLHIIFIPPVFKQFQTKREIVNTQK